VNERLDVQLSRVPKLDLVVVAPISDVRVGRVTVAELAELARKFVLVSMDIGIGRLAEAAIGHLSTISATSAARCRFHRVGRSARLHAQVFLRRS
jgi:hypothetical protein